MCSDDLTQQNRPSVSVLQIARHSKAQAQLATHQVSGVFHLQAREMVLSLPSTCFHQTYRGLACTGRSLRFVLLYWSFHTIWDPLSKQLPSPPEPMLISHRQFLANICFSILSPQFRIPATYEIIKYLLLRLSHICLLRLYRRVSERILRILPFNYWLLFQQIFPITLLRICEGAVL